MADSESDSICLPVGVMREGWVGGVDDQILHITPGQVPTGGGVKVKFSNLSTLFMIRWLFVNS